MRVKFAQDSANDSTANLAMLRSRQAAKNEGPSFRGDPESFRAKFQDFVAGTFFKTMLAEMRKTVSEGPLMHGGRAEEIFRAQMDQTIAERFAQEHGAGFADKMFEQFTRMHSLSPEVQAAGETVLHDDRSGRKTPDGLAVNLDRVA